MVFSVQPAFVLHRRLYRETSLILELFTRDYGRISVLARGVRKARSPSAGLLQVFVPIVVSGGGKTELLHLSQVEADGGCGLLVFGREQLPCAFYLNELLLNLVPKQDPDPALFLLYKQTLSVLQHADLRMRAPALRIFEKKLLLGAGYGLPLHAQLHNTFANEQYYAFNVATGFVPYTHKAHNMTNVFLGRTINAVLTEYFADHHILQDAKRLLGFLLSLVLEGRKIHSRQLFFGV